MTERMSQAEITRRSEQRRKGGGGWESDVVAVARNAWEKAPVGSSDFQGHRVVKDEKIVLVTQEEANSERPSFLNIFGFPHERDFRRFELAASTHFGIWAGLGPHYNGCIGNLRFHDERPDDGYHANLDRARMIPGLRERVFVYDQAQWNIRVDHSVKTPSKIGLPSKPTRLDSKTYHTYAGWLNRAMIHAFTLAQEREADVVFFKNYSRPPYGQGRFYRYMWAGIANTDKSRRVPDPRTSDVEKAIKHAIKKTGAKIIVNNRHQLVIRPQAEE